MPQPKTQKGQNSLRRAALAHPIREENIQINPNHQINPNYLQRRFTSKSHRTIPKRSKPNPKPKPKPKSKSFPIMSKSPKIPRMRR